MRKRGKALLAILLTAGLFIHLFEPVTSLAQGDNSAYAALSEELPQEACAVPKDNTSQEEDTQNYLQEDPSRSTSTKNSYALSPFSSAPVSELSDATIVDEILSLREVNVKHFYKTDGSRAAYIYTIPVHEQLFDGSWTDIDNTLYESKNEAGETVYSRKGLSFHIDFSAELSDGLVYSFTGADGSFSLSLENLPKGESVKASYTHAEKEPSYEKLFTPAIGGVLTYKDIFPGVDLSYQLVGNSVKENLILQNISSGRDPNRKTK